MDGNFLVHGGKWLHGVDLQRVSDSFLWSIWTKDWQYKGMIMVINTNTAMSSPSPLQLFKPYWFFPFRRGNFIAIKQTSMVRRGFYFMSVCFFKMELQGGYLIVNTVCKISHLRDGMSMIQWSSSLIESWIENKIIWPPIISGNIHIISLCMDAQVEKFLLCIFKYNHVVGCRHIGLWREYLHFLTWIKNVKTKQNGALRLKSLDCFQQNVSCPMQELFKHTATRLCGADDAKTLQVSFKQAWSHCTKRKYNERGIEPLHACLGFILSIHLFKKSQRS